MTPQTELMEKMIVLAQGLGISLTLSELSSDGGTYAELTPGRIETLYYDKTAIRTFPVLFIAKDTDQEKCLERLAVLCNAIQGMTVYPKAETFQWIGAETATEPGKIGRDADGKYLYSCTIECQLYY